MEPLRIVEVAGYDNYVLEREDKSGKTETVIANVLFMVSFHYPTPLLARAAEDIEEELQDEGDDQEQHDDETLGAAVRTAKAAGSRAAASTAPRGRRKTVGGADSTDDADGKLMETRRRRRRNRAGQYVLEYELRDADTVRHDPAFGGRDGAMDGRGNGTDEGRRRWVSVSEYERLTDCGRAVEDPPGEECV